MTQSPIFMRKCSVELEITNNLYPGKTNDEGRGTKDENLEIILVGSF